MRVARARFNKNNNNARRGAHSRRRKRGGREGLKRRGGWGGDGNGEGTKNVGAILERIDPARCFLWAFFLEAKERGEKN